LLKLNPCFSIKTNFVYLNIFVIKATVGVLVQHLKIGFVLTDQISMLMIWRNYTYSRPSFITKSILSDEISMLLIWSSYPYSRSSILYCTTGIFLLHIITIVNKQLEKQS